MKMVIYDGANTIGGSKIHVEEGDNGLFLDFGMNFAKYSLYYEEFISERTARGIYDLWHLNLIPKLNIYRRDLIPRDLVNEVPRYPKVPANAVLISHAHLDHVGNVALLDENIPVVGSPTTIAILKALNDTSSGGSHFGMEIPYYKVKKNKDEEGYILEADRNSHYPSRKVILSEDISSFHDFLFKFIKEAKNASVLITEGTRVGREEHENVSEQEVYENALKIVEEAKGFVIADFSARNFERLESFKEIAEKMGRELIVTAKDAYFLHALKIVDGVDRLKGLRIYGNFKASRQKWEELVVWSNYAEYYISPFEIRENQENYILCFSFYDMPHLLDIMPNGGTYI
ncbi:MBL fold metallo-hydrolase, partial [Archaeoglobales archaeon ex4484_92]